MQIVFIGDDHHSYFQEKQVEVLSKRAPDLKTIYWSTIGFQIFRELDELSAQEKLFIVASRHGAIPASHWTARNTEKVRRMVLLHPSLHLNMPGMEAPAPHFVPTMVLCHNKVDNPSLEDISDFSGKLFHDYSVHITSEPPELEASLSLLSLPTDVTS